MIRGAYMQLPKLQFPLVPKLRLGNPIAREAPLRTVGGRSWSMTQQSCGDKCVPKLELGNENNALRR